MKRSEAVQQGASLVRDLEEAAMEAVKAAALATVGLIDLRRSANLSATVGADAWDDLMQTTIHLQQGLRSSLSFHKKMGEVQVRIGCASVVANGGQDKDTMPEFPFGAARAPLQAVA